jgi:hypothetical protein
VSRKAEEPASFRRKDPLPALQFDWRASFADGLLTTDQESILISRNAPTRLMPPSDRKRHAHESCPDSSSPARWDAACYWELSFSRGSPLWAGYSSSSSNLLTRAALRPHLGYSRRLCRRLHRRRGRRGTSAFHNTGWVHPRRFAGCYDPASTWDPVCHWLHSGVRVASRGTDNHLRGASKNTLASLLRSRRRCCRRAYLCRF